MKDTGFFNEGLSVETSANNNESNPYTNTEKDGKSGDSDARMHVHRYEESTRNLGSTKYTPFVASDGSFQQTLASAKVMPDLSHSLLYRMTDKVGVSECQNENFTMNNSMFSLRSGVCNTLSGSNQVNVVDQLQLDHEHSSSIQRLPQIIISAPHEELDDSSLLKRQPPQMDHFQFNINAEEVETVNKHETGSSQIGGRNIDTHRENDQKANELNAMLNLAIGKSADSREMKSTLAIHDKKLTMVAEKASEDVDHVISLREWLGKRGRVVKRVESLHIFQQIVEFVEVAHSQGVALRNVRPSSFLLSSFNCISYIDSAHTHTSSGSSEQSVDSAVDLDGTDLELCTGARLPLLGQQEGGRTTVIPSLEQGVSRIGTGHGISSNPSSEFSEDEAQTVSSGDGPNSLQENSLQMRSQIEDAVEWFPLKQMLLMEQTWYKCDEELSGARDVFASDVYCLGVLLFELFCSFVSDLEWLRAMSDLRHRVLPPRLLLDHPKELSFCLLLLHPDPNSRPKARDVLQSDLLDELRDELEERRAAINAEEKQLELEQTVEFLLQLQSKKKQELHLLAQELAFITSDIKEVERRKYFVRHIRGGEPRYMDDGFGNLESGVIEEKIVVLGKRPYGEESQTQLNMRDKENVLDKRHDLMSSINARFMSNFDQLKQTYFALRGNVKMGSSDAMICRKNYSGKEKRSSIIGTSRSSTGFKNQIVEGMESGDFLGCFLDGLCKFVRFNRFEVKANLQHCDLLSTSNMVCSISFDRDNEFFATAGACKKIKIFEFNAVLDDSVDMHYPIVEMSASSKLSCISWNSYIKSYVASSNHDGIIQLWDSNTGQTFLDLKEHAKRAWSVIFSQIDPAKLASGSDDCTIKLWNINQKSSVGTIKTKANVCSVQFAPGSSYLLASGSADQTILCYDLRNFRKPMHILAGHNRAVSFVRFIDDGALVSASSDNTIKLWDITKLNTAFPRNACTMTFTGHTNQKNFVGLSVNDGGYIACGSETNEVFAYHKAFPRPMMSHKFLCLDPISGEQIEGHGRQFVSSVCWQGNSHTLLAANSIGNVQVLEMV